MNKKSATIYDISKKFNVSVATVSRALNDHPRISEATKDLVRKTAKEMNYKQNNLAKALKSGETKNVGIIVPYINTNFFSSVIRA
ncbi:LacI family transcriptional regulator [Chryseobacterium sp. SSA4.19]|uniref:LacI family DNA-binding transcriptional regulator n=1 Tax=Chryseobacterium sp. SSA4.19 TaxID=2919915 RepID=UPI001F4D8CA0|nr:LacI family DNA-binding transcriptional regulator [Chryseobacterium sp. SSA4.19]MCJ8154413.1 LacI family transcriptional regulator [Chryseobacterium sp. SSA4.19]